MKYNKDGKEYDDHLFADMQTGMAKIKLNGWEADLIEEESRRSDFLCWLRNPSRAPWALCLPYEMNGEKKSFYPDFLIIRSDPTVDYVVDILEPHGNQYTVKAMFNNIDIFGIIDDIAACTLDDVKSRLNTMLDINNSTLSVIKPQ